MSEIDMEFHFSPPLFPFPSSLHSFLFASLRPVQQELAVVFMWKEHFLDLPIQKVLKYHHNVFRISQYLNLSKNTNTILSRYIIFQYILKSSSKCHYISRTCCCVHVKRTVLWSSLSDISAAGIHSQIENTNGTRRDNN